MWIDQLKSVLPENDVLFGEKISESYGKDEVLGLDPVRPRVVVRPSTTEQSLLLSTERLKRIVEIDTENRVAVAQICRFPMT